MNCVPMSAFMYLRVRIGANDIGIDFKVPLAEKSAPIWPLRCTLSKHKCVYILKYIYIYIYISFDQHDYWKSYMCTFNHAHTHTRTHTHTSVIWGGWSLLDQILSPHVHGQSLSRALLIYPDMQGSASRIMNAGARLCLCKVCVRMPCKSMLGSIN